MNTYLPSGWSHKEGHLTLCGSVDGPRGYGAACSTPGRKGQAPHDLTSTWDLKNKTQDRQNRKTPRPREQTNSL